MPRKSLKSLGSKYGATVRKQYTRVYRILHSKRRCPSCGSIRFTRIATGVWGCRKCGHTVAGSAYDVSTSS